MKNVFCALLAIFLLSSCTSASDATESEIAMAELMGISVEELRAQTPEEHMAMMAQLYADKKVSDTFLPGKDNLLSALPKAKKTEILEVDDGDTITLNPTLVRKTINGKEFIMYGYNEQIPGPMIKAPQGSTITVNVTNKIDMETTVHWHGLRLDNSQDGVPGMTQQAIQPDSSHTYTITFPDEGIYWYHPHVREDIQQDLGLYGNLFVTPKHANLYAPVNREEMIVLDDLLLSQDGIEPYGKDVATRTLMGRFGNTMLINGTPIGWGTDQDEPPSITVQRGDVVRFHITNVASTRTFRLQIPNSNVRIKRIGSDVGRYEEEEFVDHILIAPAERYIVDVLFEGQYAVNINHVLPEGAQSGFGPIAVLSVNIDSNPTSNSYKEEFNTLHTHEDVVEDIDAFRHEFNRPVDKTLELSVELGGNMDHSDMHHEMVDGIEWEDTMAEMNKGMTNDEVEWKLIDSQTGEKNMEINWQFKTGDVKKIRIINKEDSAHPMQHPIHFHGQRFLVLAVDGKPNKNLVWKDTVLVPTGSSVDLLFDLSNPGHWMFHCHIAEHLTNGMMGMFTVSD